MSVFAGQSGGKRFYSWARSCYRRYTQPKLGALLNPSGDPALADPSALAPLSLERLEAFQRTQVTPLVTALLDAFGAWNLPAPLPLLQDTRRQQLAELTGEDETLSQEERKKNHYLVVSLIALGITSATTLFHSPLIIASVPLLGYIYIDMFRDAHRAFREKRHRLLRVFEMVVVGGEILAGLYFASSLSAVLYFVGERALIKTESRSRQSLINVFGQQPRSVWVLVDGTECEVPIEQVQVDDIVVVSAGEIIPVDGIIIQGSASIDQHMLTGEAQPAEKGEHDPVLASTLVLSGKIAIQVERAGSATAAAQIGRILNQTAEFRQHMELRGIALVERFLPFTMAMGALSLPFVGANRALALLESSFGYNFRVSGPMSMLNLLQLAAREGILIKDGAVLETLPTVDTIVFDKTGTLTLEQPHVSTIHTYNGVSAETVLTWAAAAEHRQTHPIARAIVQAARQQGLTVPAIDDAHYQVGYGIRVSLEGATIRVGSDRFLMQEQVELPEALQQLQRTCYNEGYSLVLVSMNQTLVGAIELHPTIRPEAHAIVQELKQRNLNLYIISGDHEQPTRHMASSIGIDHYFAGVLPQDKASLVAQLQREGRTVCFVGDGINDSIALKQADLSISLRGASTAATDTAQVVLMDGTLNHLVALLDLGHEFKSNMQGNLLLATVPSVLCIGGVYLLKWGVVTSLLLYNVSLVGSLGNAFLPLLKHHLLGQQNMAKSVDSTNNHTFGEG